MRYFFYYFQINKWYKYQKYIAIIAKIDIYIAKFELKENEKIYRYNNVGHASTIIEKIAIVKQKTKNYKKTYRKKLVIYLLLIF